MNPVTAVAYKSPLHEMTQSTPTCLWNDSASIQELTYSIEHGATGATCNPVIVLGVLKKEMAQWKERINTLIHERPTATEDEIAWQLVREVSMKGAALLRTFPLRTRWHGRWASVARDYAMLYEIAAAKSRRGRTNAGGGLAPIRAAVDHRYFGRKASV